MARLSEILQAWKQNPGKAFRIIAFGSSNTEQGGNCEGRFNWAEWLNTGLRNNIGKHCTVISQGIGGNTTEDLLARIGRDVLFYRPDIVIITIGGNDAARQMPPEQYRKNLKTICEMVGESGAVPVLQTYYCPVYSGGDEVFRRFFETHMQTCRDLAAELDLPLIDQLEKFKPFYYADPQEYQKLMFDWLHVNYLGNLVMGVYTAEAFGLPRFEFPPDIRAQAEALFEKIKYYCMREEL